MESWEAAAEFGIPESEWAQYDVRRRSDDLYIASLASIFDALRVERPEEREKDMAAIAKTLVVYSQSAATRYLNGVEKQLNQLYCAALYYLAGFPATATLLAQNLDSYAGELNEESFLYSFLKKQMRENNPFSHLFSEIIRSDENIDLTPIITRLQEQVVLGLKDDPRRFIAAKLALSCITRFAEYNVWKALKQYSTDYSSDIWRPFLGNGQNFLFWELLPSQLTAIRAGLLSNSDDAFSLQMPTSSGKTALCELLLYHEVKIKNRRVLFLVPFRALASEIKEGMSHRLEGAGVRIIASHGGNIPTRSETTSIEDADVLIVTPEKFMTLIQIIPDLANQYQTIICDEGHLIDDESRGLQYELLLTKLQGKKEHPRRIIFISAILPNVNEIHEWLGGKPEHLALSQYRPVETDYAFLSAESNDSWRLDVNPLQPQPRSYYLKRFLVKDDFRFLNPETERNKLINGWATDLSLACAAALKARRNGSVALFTTTRGNKGIEGLSNKLLDLLESGANVVKKSPQISDRLPNLIEFITFLFGAEYSLVRLLQHSIGFHHGLLPQEIRRAMENALHDRTINMLLCTNTLAEGVNLPIRTLVVHTVRRYDAVNQVWKYLQNRNIKNIIGRAGRASKETRGRVLFISAAERSQVLNVLQDTDMESAHGFLFRLIEAINNFILRNKIPLNNETFENQKPWFLSLIDSIDLTLLDLIPPDTAQQDIGDHISDMLERTLAYRYCKTDEIRSCLNTVFNLRVQYLQKSITPESWPILRKSGTAPRLWTFISSSKFLENQIWLTLADSSDDYWFNHIILNLLKFPSLEINTESDILVKCVRGWMQGMTYVELAQFCGKDIDEILKILCTDIGYRLQDCVAKLCQLAFEHYGEDSLSEIARNWPSLLQFGLGTLQQLDLFEKGCSERLAVWGASRYLQRNQINLRRNELLDYLRANGREVCEVLSRDQRVPTMSRERFCSELRIS